MNSISLSPDWCAARRAELLQSYSGYCPRQSGLPLNSKFDTEHLVDIKSKVFNGRVALSAGGVRKSGNQARAGFRATLN